MQATIYYKTISYGKNQESYGPGCCAIIYETISYGAAAGASDSVAAVLTAAVLTAADSMSGQFCSSRFSGSVLVLVLSY